MNNNLIVHSLNYIPNCASICNPKCFNLEKVLEIKYLGIILDYRLKWDIHINFVNNSLRKLFYIFKETRYIFNNYLFITNTVFFSYGLSIWAGTYNIHLSRLNVTINCVSYLFINTIIYK